MRKRFAKMNVITESREERLPQRVAINLPSDVTTPLPGFQIEGEPVEFAGVLIQEHERAGFAHGTGRRPDEVIVSRRQTRLERLARSEERRVGKGCRSRWGATAWT